MPYILYAEHFHYSILLQYYKFVCKQSYLFDIHNILYFTYSALVDCLIVYIHQQDELTPIGRTSQRVTTARSDINLVTRYSAQSKNKVDIRWV